MARLMMSAAVPCMGALMALRSAYCRSRGVARLNLRQVQPAAKHRLDVAGFTRLAARLLHIALHARITLEVKIHVLLRFAAGYS